MILFRCTYIREIRIYNIRCFQAYLLEIGKNRKHFIDFFYCVVHVLYEGGGDQHLMNLKKKQKLDTQWETTKFCDNCIITAQSISC